MQESLDNADFERCRRLYLEGLSADYAALRKDYKANADLDEENEIWESATDDGLEDL